MSDVYGYVYEIVNKVNGKVYVGQTTQTVEKRWEGHKYSAKYSRPFLISKAIRKHGPDNFTVEILATASSKKELDNLEALYIEGLNTMVPNGYNLKEGGSAGKLSRQSIQKMAETKKGTPAWNKGKKGCFSSEAVEKMSRAKKGRSALNRIAVIDSNGKIYASTHAAAKEIDCSPSLITLVLKGKNKTAKGLTFQYYQPTAS